MATTRKTPAAAPPPSAGPSASILLGVVLLLIAGAAGFWWLSGRSNGGSSDIGRLEALVSAANAACAQSTSGQDGAKVSADLSALVGKVKAEGGVSAFREKYVGPNKALPPEVQALQLGAIRECMAQYMPDILRSVGVEMRSQLPPSLELRFTYGGRQDEAADDTARLNFEVNEHFVEVQRLAVQPTGWFAYPSDFPSRDGGTVEGTITRQLRHSELVPTAAVAASFCLKRPSPQRTHNDRWLHVECSDAGACAVHQPSPPWLEICPQKKVDAGGFSWWPTAHAAEAPTAERSWSVPSAQTLEAHEEAVRGVGYTLFDLQTDAFANAPDVIGVEFDVRVNGVPVYEDGLAPRQRPLALAPGQPLRHRFALEQLDFEGANAGCEDVRVTLTPRSARGAEPQRALSVRLAYVALRDKAEERLAVGSGSASVSLAGSYKIPTGEWSHEAMIASLVYRADADEAEVEATRRRATALKAAFDRLGLQHDGKDLVAVVRPPLTLRDGLLAYGVTTGVRQPSGQVRFTFGREMAERIADTLLAARGTSPAARSLIAPERYIYQVAANAQRRNTATPSGICPALRSG